MPTTHLSLAGAWGLCEDEANCPSIYHLPNLTPTEAAGLPSPMVESLLNAVDPGKRSYPDQQEWEDAEGYTHRDYDLPARVYVEGQREWYQHGLRHRAGDKPAVIHADDAMEWWEHGKRQRSSGGPAITAEPGLALWYRQDEYLYGYLYYPEFLGALEAAQRAELKRGYQPMKLPLYALRHEPLPPARPARTRMMYQLGLPFVEVVDLRADDKDWLQR